MTTARRVPFDLPQRFRTAIDGQTPGTLGGRITGTSPIPGGDSDDDATTAGAFDPAVDLSPESFYSDAFTATDGAQDLTLTYLPVDYSIHVYLNGLEQRLGTDWTVDDNVVSVLTAMGAVSGDLIDVLYAYTSSLPATPDDSTDIDLPGTGFDDDFQRPDGPVGNGWYVAGGDVDDSWQIVDGTLRLTSGFSAETILHDFTTPPDSLVQVAFSMPDESSHTHNCVLTMQAPAGGSSNSRIQVFLESTDLSGVHSDANFWVYDHDGSLIYSHSVTYSDEYKSGGTLRLTKNGDVYKGYYNGVEIGTYTDTGGVVDGWQVLALTNDSDDHYDDDTERYDTYFDNVVTDGIWP